MFQLLISTNSNSLGKKKTAVILTNILYFQNNGEFNQQDLQYLPNSPRQHRQCSRVTMTSADLYLLRFIK